MGIKDRSRKVHKKGMWYCCGSVLRSNFCPQCGSAYPIEDPFNIACATITDSLSEALSKMRAANTITTRMSYGDDYNHPTSALGMAEGNVKSAKEKMLIAQVTFEQATNNLLADVQILRKIHLDQEHMDISDSDRIDLKRST